MGVTNRMNKRLVLALTLVCLATFVSGCVDLLVHYYGTVVDFTTKQPIAQAELHVAELIYTDVNGSFDFYFPPEPSSLNIKSISAAGYGTLYDIGIKSTTDNIIYLTAPQKVYGILNIANPETYKLAIEDAAYQGVAYPNALGEFSFAGIPINQRLSISIYAGQQKSTYSPQVCIFSDKESQFIQLEGDRITF